MRTTIARSAGEPAIRCRGGRHGVDLRDGPGCILLAARGDDHVREIHQSGGLDPPVAASSPGAQRILDCLLGTPVVACSQPHPGVEECHYFDLKNPVWRSVIIGGGAGIVFGTMGDQVPLWESLLPGGGAAAAGGAGPG